MLELSQTLLISEHTRKLENASKETPILAILGILGITIDESLGWSTHINNVSKQASQTSAWVLRTFTTRQPFPLMTH